MQTAITFTGTAEEIADLLEKINGEDGGTVTGPAKAKAPKRLTAASIANKSFDELKKIASELDIDLKGKKSAGLRKAILEAQDEPDEDEEELEEETDSDEDDDWEDEDEEDEEGDDEDEESEDEEDEEEEDEEEPAPRRPAKRTPAKKAPARKATAAKKAPARRRR